MRVFSGEVSVLYLIKINEPKIIDSITRATRKRKTTLANLLSENKKYPVFSVDDYFTDTNGNYHFKFDENHLAYKLCEENTRKAMIENVGKIFLHNTFTIDWELEIYFKLAKEFDYQIHILTVENYHGPCTLR
eukprot:Opistho-1_new@96064